LFSGRNTDLIVKDSPPGQLFSLLDAAFQKFSKHATRQAAGMDTVCRSTGGRDKARRDLVAQLDTICRTASGLGLEHFWMPRGRNDLAFVRAGRNFLGQLEPLKPVFLEGHMPEDFIEKLQTAVQTLDDAIRKQTDSEATRVEATAAIHDARNEALAILKRLDPLVENLVRDNPPVRAVWESARRVEKAGGSKKLAEEDQPGIPLPAPPSGTNTAATANTA
jgi:hypothetical protein